MKLQFNLEYRTHFGEMLMLNITEGTVGTQSQPMSTVDGLNWTADILSDEPATCPLTYYYSVVRGDDVARHEWLVEPHRLEVVADRMRVFDRWIDIPDDAYLYSSAFTECVARRDATPQPASPVAHPLVLKVRAPQLRSGERLALVGAPVSLGQWQTERALPMTEHADNEWVVALDVQRLPGWFEYKFIILGQHGMVVWENSLNRTLELDRYMVSSQYASAKAQPCAAVVEVPQAWFSLPQWRLAGTVVPVFSLRTEGSFGVGDFGDLQRMIDWCAKTHQRVLQVLPINDTTITHTWQDSYPYNSISIYALHPQYTDLRQLPAIKDEALRARFEQLRQELNALPQIDYERVNEAKMACLRELFRQEWAAVSRRTSYRDFYAQNEAWLVPYAAFCYYRDKYGTAVFSEWPDEATLEAVTRRMTPVVQKELNFWFYVQYNLDRQMRAAHDHARSNHVVLKGDIPIGISRDGVEAWVEPRYFNLNGQAGAPPDDFSRDGQNWGFPTYNWDEMLADGCTWWVRRFRKMAEYFDAYRIDHVLGFFRIWEIPVPEKSGLMGQFSPALGLSREEIEGYGLHGHDELFLRDHKRSDRWHPRIAVQYQEAYQNLTDDERLAFNHLYDDYFYRRNNQFWYNEAMKKLPRLTQATRMLVCAEDLGMVPDCVPWVMNDLRILSLEIQSMPKTPGLRFGRLQQNPYRSVDTISTHDMATLRQWWDEDDERTQDFYQTELGRTDAAPHPLPGWLAKEIVSRHLMSPSMLCLVSLQDWLSVDEQLRLPDQNAERINIPANPRHYWRYRMHLTIEQLMQADELNREITIMIKQSGRQ